MKALHPSDAVLIKCPDDFPNCEPLPIVINGGEVTSFWQPEPVELQALNMGGCVMLSFPGGHPVIRAEVTQYPAVLATMEPDEQCELSARSFAKEWEHESSSAEGAAIDAFAAGVLWQKGRAVSTAEMDAAIFAIIKDANANNGVQLTKHGFERYKVDHPEGYGAIQRTLLVALEGIQMERMK
jgi:hypothetical protein